MRISRLFAFTLLPAVASLALADAGEDLTTPPITTSKAWAIADGKTGQLIASHQADEPLKSASTTKVMCAFVILELAKQNPAVLDEVVTISRLADATAGSTADVRAGEKLTIREGLYGMLLPSGNDMGNAFAEHFNQRLEPPGKDAPAAILKPEYKTRRNFIAEMNRAAARLRHEAHDLPPELRRRRHGRGPHHHGARLLTLGHAAMQNPLFREIVRTQDHAGKVMKPDGKERAADWKNSNKLLALGDYDGIKTGVTNSAGHCLLAGGQKDGVSLMVGSSAAFPMRRASPTRGIFSAGSGAWLLVAERRVTSAAKASPSPPNLWRPASCRRARWRGCESSRWMRATL